MQWFKKNCLLRFDGYRDSTKFSNLSNSNKLFQDVSLAMTNGILVPIIKRNYTMTYMSIEMFFKWPMLKEKGFFRFLFILTDFN
jgi:hypothetical protein